MEARSLHYRQDLKRKRDATEPEAARPAPHTIFLRADAAEPEHARPAPDTIVLHANATEAHIKRESVGATSDNREARAKSPSHSSGPSVKQKPAGVRTVIGFANARGGPPPAKKQRVDTSTPRSIRKISQSSNSAPRRRLGDHDDTGVVFVDEEYDDVGEPIELDDLNLLGPSRSRNSHPALDSPSTAPQPLRPLLAPEDRGQDSDDPNECYPPQSSEPSVNWGPTTAKGRIDVFPKMVAITQPALQRINFSYPSTSNFQKGIKPKNPSATPSSDPGPGPNSMAAAKPDKRQFLPIKAWFLGRKFFDEPYNLVWNPSGKMSLRSGNDPSVKAKHSEEIDINWIAQSVSFVGPEEPYLDKVFILETFERFPDKKTGHQKPFGTNYSTYFKQGAKHAEGQVMIKFDSASPTWADATYGHFVDWLKVRVDKRESLRGKEGDARWETMKRIPLLADAAEARIKREAADAANGNARANLFAVPGLPALDAWSPPATIAVANIAKGTTHAQHLSGPSTLIESESPPRPRPRLQNPSAAPSSDPGPEPSSMASAKPDERQFLPIKAWYLGCKLFDEPYNLVWNPAGKMTLRSGKDPSVKAKHSEEIDINWVAQSVSFVGPEESYPDKVFVLETFEKFPDKKTGHQKPFGANYSAYFKQGGKHAEGQIMIKFDSGSPTWSDATYWHFVDWLKTRVDKRESLRGKGGDARWETMKRVNLLAEAAEARIKREIADAANGNARAKNPAVPGLPALDPWSPPATIAIANTAKVTTRSQRLGSPTTPIEIESPTRPRPRPRPINSRPESDTAGGGHEPVRRSARQSVAPQRPHVDPDEVILVYPPGQTGAVNITNGDVSRLTPGEFLNDTLIEFGLKLWLQDLEKENPELVKQIHVFSSFFYKKLNKKNPQEGYESVRKWTAKFDLFDKKYIIVPINENLHWYLAIIYQPEHTLKPPPPTKSPTTRRKTRQGVEQSPEVDQVPVSRTETSSRPPDSKASSVTRRTPTPIDTAASGSGSRSPSGTLSPSSNMQAEAEVVNELTACSITEDDTDVAAPEASDKSEAHDTDEHDSLFDDPMDVDVDTETPLGAIGEQSSLPPDSGDLLNDGGSHTASEGPAEPEVMDVDDPDQSMDPLDLFADDPSPPTVSEPVKTANFYSAKSRGKRKATSPPLEALPAELYEEEVEDDQPWTYVFTLDSLGSRHPKVTNVLAQYLKFEAQERKGIPLEMSRKAIGKIALVPHQPNFCDCGIYLLHLAETFISNPVFYHDLIIKQKGPTNSLDRQLQWNDDRTKTLRQKLTERIGELSKEWKKNRAAQKELEKTQEEVVAESSDDDVDIVDTTPAAPPRPEKTPKTGKAMRMRG